MIFPDYWKVLVLNFSLMGNTVFLSSQKVDGKIIFTWSFWAFYDIPWPGKYVFFAQCTSKIKNLFSVLWSFIEFNGNITVTLITTPYFMFFWCWFSSIFLFYLLAQNWLLAKCVLFSLSFTTSENGPNFPSIFSVRTTKTKNFVM